MRRRNLSFVVLLGILVTACRWGATPAAFTPPEVIASISRPVTGESFPRWSPIPVWTSTQSEEPVRTLEFWVDGVLMESVTPDSYTTRFEWVAEEQGPHALLVRAVTESGATAFSNKVTVSVSEDVATMVRLLTTGEGDTVESIAEAFAASPQEILTLNPGLVAGEAIPPETALKVPHNSRLETIVLNPPPVSPEVQPGTTIPAQPFAAPGFLAGLGDLFGTETRPIAPTVAATSQGCTVQLVILDQADNEAGFRIYRLDSTTATFVAIAELAAGDGTLPLLYTDFDLSGAVNYYATAFNGAGESEASNLTGVNISSAACKSAFWDVAETAALGLAPQAQGAGTDGGNGTGGGAAIFDTFIPQVYDQLYYYVSLSDGPWSRVPRFENEFIVPDYGFFDLEKLLDGVVQPPATGTLTAEIDVWGWSGGNLIHIGSFQRTFEAPENQEPFVVYPGQLELCSIESCGEFGDWGIEWTGLGGPRSLRWTPGPGTTAGLLQVSRSPFDSGCELEPAGVFMTRVVETASQYVTMTVDYPKLGEDDYSIPIPQLDGSPSVFVSGAALPQAYYTRVLPLFNGQPSCDSTNMVSFFVQKGPEVVVQGLPSAPEPPLGYTVDIVEFTPIHFPDYTFQYCVTITENPYAGQDPFVLIDQQMYLEASWADIAVGQNLCPQPYVYEEPGVLEQISGFLKEALNTISWVYSALKDLVINIVAHLLPLCAEANLAAELGSDTGAAIKEEIEGFCNGAAEIAVNAAMTYVGLPPSIPNYDQLMETAKGQATDIIAQQFEAQTGLPCIDACREFIRDGLDQMQEVLEDAVSDSACMGEYEAHDNGIEPLCMPDFIKSVPMREGTLEPAVVRLVVTRNGDAPDSAFPDPAQFTTSCTLGVSAFANNDRWVGQEVFLGSDYQSGSLQYWTGTSLQGAPFKNVFGAVPVLAPGESTDVVLALAVNRGSYPPGDGFWLPGRLKIIQDHVLGSQLVDYYGTHYDDWSYLYFGSQLSVTAKVACTTEAEGYAPAQSQASDVWIEQIPAEQ